MDLQHIVVQHTESLLACSLEQTGYISCQSSESVESTVVVEESAEAKLFVVVKQFVEEAHSAAKAQLDGCIVVQPAEE